MNLHRSLSLMVASLPFVAACAAPAPDTGAPTGTSSSALGSPLHARTLTPTKGGVKGLTPDAVGIDDLLTIYEAYQTISTLVQFGADGSDPTAQVMAQLGQIESQMNTIIGDQQAVIQELQNLAYQQAQGQYLLTMQNVQTAQAQARTASQQLTEWVATGKKKKALLASADNNSQLAANTLMSSSFYYRPASVAGQPDIFDLRQVLTQYLYALMVRVAVIGLEDPDFRCPGSSYVIGNCQMPYESEFEQHLAWLQQLPGRNAGNIQASSLINGSGESYQICSWALDTNSKFTSVIDGGYPAPSQPTCTEDLWGDATEQADALAFYQFWDHWNVEEEMGIHLIEKAAALVEVDATQDIAMPILTCIPINGQKCPPAYRPRGPIVSSDGQCLASGVWQFGVWIGGLTLAPCDKGAEQTWQTANDRGQTAEVSLADGSTCVEASLWDPTLAPYLTTCGDSPGEQFTVGTHDELQWQRDESQCLTAVGSSVAFQPCNGSPEQKWVRYAK